jgi:hypothetical protein
VEKTVRRLRVVPVRGRVQKAAQATGALNLLIFIEIYRRHKKHVR